MPNPNTVDRSPHKQEILDLLNSGWSPRRVRRYLVERHDNSYIPSEKAIERYRSAHIDPVAVLPAKLITEAMRSLDGRIDEIQKYDVAIRAQEQRIALFWKRELENGVADPLFSDALRVYNEYLHRRFQLAAQLGLGRAGKDKRVAMTETRTLQLPEESFREMIELLHKYGLTDDEPDVLGRRARDGPWGSWLATCRVRRWGRPRQCTRG